MKINTIKYHFNGVNMDSGKISKSNIFIWNIIGSLSNAFVSVILLMIITKITNPTDGGIFSLAFAAAQLMFTIGSFAMRIFQSTDVNETFKFKEYFTSRILSCIAMLIATFIYILIKGYSGKMAAVVLLMCIYKLIDAFSDVFQGMFQQYERLDLAGQSLTLRVFTSIIGFGITLYNSNNLVLASLIAVLISIICVFCFDIYYTKKFVKIELSFNINVLKDLFLSCLPLFITEFLIMYVYNSPKYAIDSYMALEYQTYFNALFMPASIINLLNIVFRPLLTSLAVYWNNDNIKEFLSTIFIMVGGIILFTLVTIVGGYILGLPILSIMYSCDLSSYKLEFIIILIGGGFNALSNILSNIITVMRQQKFLIYVYIITCLAALIICPILVSKYGLLGASISYLILMSIFALLIFVLFLIAFKILNKKRVN